MSSTGDLPLVSIITPVYNGAKYLDQLICSVRDQDYPRVEHIVIDDGSDDQGATVAVLKKYPHLRWWTRANRGQYATMNEGLDAASGEIVCFISADDVMAEQAIHNAVAYTTSHRPGFDGVYGKYTYIEEQGAIYWYQPLIRRAPLSFYRYSPFIAHCSLYLRRDVLLAKGLHFDASLRYTGDYDWLVRIHAAGLRLGYLNRTLSLVRWHDDRASSKSIRAMKQELASLMRQYSVNPHIFRLINASIDRFLMLKQLAKASLVGSSDSETRRLQDWLAARRIR